MKLTLFQLRVRDSVAENIRAVQESTGHLTGETILLPELFSTGFDYDLIDSLDETHTAVLSQLPAGNRYIGSVVRVAPDGRYNSLFLKDDSGVRFVYDKVHLFPLMDEHVQFSAGGGSSLFPLGAVSAGGMICFDIRFAEQALELRRKGMELLVIPAEWPALRAMHLRTLALARAIEHQCFVAVCNTAGMVHGTLFGGGSCIISPWGEVLADALDAEDALVQADMDFSQVAEVRRRIPMGEKR